MPTGVHMRPGWAPAALHLASCRPALAAGPCTATTQWEATARRAPAPCSRPLLTCPCSLSMLSTRSISARLTMPASLKAMPLGDSPDPTHRSLRPAARVQQPGRCWRRAPLRRRSLPVCCWAAGRHAAATHFTTRPSPPITPTHPPTHPLCAPASQSPPAAPGSRAGRSAPPGTRESPTS